MRIDSCWLDEKLVSAGVEKSKLPLAWERVISQCQNRWWGNALVEAIFLPHVDILQPTTSVQVVVRIMLAVTYRRCRLSRHLLLRNYPSNQTIFCFSVIYYFLRVPRKISSLNHFLFISNPFLRPLTNIPILEVSWLFEFTLFLSHLYYVKKNYCGIKKVCWVLTQISVLRSPEPIKVH